MPISAELITTEQERDRALGKVIELLREAPDDHSWSRGAGLSKEVQDLWAQAASLTLVRNILYRKYERPDGTIQYLQLVVPTSLRAQVLRHVHGGTALGHFGVNKTASMLQKYGYWSGWRKDVESAVRVCDVCNRYRHGPRSKQGELQPQPSNFPMQKFHIDLTGPHVRSKHGFTYLFTGICNFTKYLIAVPIRDKTASTVARVLVKYVYLQYGAVDILVSDNGGEFANEIAHQLNEAMGIQGIHITAYRPSSNGVCERVHRSLHSVFAKTIAANQKDWCERVPYVTYAYNIASHSATTYSPFFLMFGREAKTNLNNLLEIPDEERQHTPETYAQEVTHKLAEAYDLVCEALNCKFDRAKQRYDARVKPVQFKVGQFVWFYCPRKRPGLNPKWTNRNTGPHLIVRRHNLVNYSIRFSPRGDRVKIVHVDRLTPYFGEVSPEWRKQQRLLVLSEQEKGLGSQGSEPATLLDGTISGDPVVPSAEEAAGSPTSGIIIPTGRNTPTEPLSDTVSPGGTGESSPSGTLAPAGRDRAPESLPEATLSDHSQSSVDCGPPLNGNTAPPVAADDPVGPLPDRPKRPRIKPARFRLVAHARPQLIERVVSIVNNSDGGHDGINFINENKISEFNLSKQDGIQEKQVRGTLLNGTEGLSTASGPP